MKSIKLLSLFLSIIICAVSFTGCLNEKKPETKVEDKTPPLEEKTDFSYISERGKLLVGITEYKPMNFIDDAGEWTGFDSEFARLVAKELGLDVEFVLIDWGERWNCLNDKTIDCIWNGMTLSNESEEMASCSDPYIRNAQVIVTRLEDSEAYTDVKSLEGARVAVEVLSAGMNAARSAQLNLLSFPLQKDALMAVLAGKADACVIDITMARAMTGKGNEYEDLAIAFPLTNEQYAIACRKGSDLTERINDIMRSLVDDGTLERLASKYELTLSSSLTEE